jgi:outer membrane protein
MKTRLAIAALAALATYMGDEAFARDLPVPLSMSRAVALALSSDGNARIRLSGEQVWQAELRAVEARSALLPAFDGSISERTQTSNLSTLGLSPAMSIGGLRLPTAVGPFSVFDARVAASQTLFDLSSIRRVQAAGAAIDAARADGADVKEQVAARVAKVYLSALRAQASVEAVKANVALAEAVLKQAENAKHAGSATGIETTRARVQLSNEQQRLLSAEIDRRRSLLEVRRAIGLRLDTPVELTDRLTYVSIQKPALADALAKARTARGDVAAQRARVLDAGYARAAAVAERLPTISVFADYGSAGTDVGSAFATRTFGVTLRIPFFDGGRREARQAAAASRVREEHLRGEDLDQQVELELRIALESLELAKQQVEVTGAAVGLAEDEVAQARRRHLAGVASGVEVTDAQTRLARARDDEIAALFNYNEARLAFGQATGTVREMIP